MSTPLSRLRMPMVVTQPNIAQPPYNDCENPKILHPHFPIVYRDTALTVFNLYIQTPKFHGSNYPYRDHVTAFLSLSGSVLQGYSGAVLGGEPALPNQLVLWCYAKCGSCASFMHSKCHPIGFYLNPKYGQKNNPGFKLDQPSGTLTGTVTFNIDHRPRKPKLGDPTRRCAEEALQCVL